MQKAFPLVVIMLLVAVVLSACGGSSPTQETANPDNNSANANVSAGSAQEIEAVPQTAVETEAQEAAVVVEDGAAPLLSIGRGEPVAVSYSPDGATLAVAVPRGVWLYDTSDFGAPPRWLQAQFAPVYWLAYSADGTRLATASWDGGITVWNTADETVISTFDVPLTANRPPMSLSAAGSTLAIYSSAAIRQYGVAEGFVLNLDLDMEQRIRHGSMNSVAYSPDGQYLVTTGSDASVRVWDAESHDEVLMLELEPGRQITNAIYSPDGSRIAIFALGLLVRDATSGEELHTVGERLVSGVYSADGSRIVGSTFEQGVVVFDTSVGEVVFSDNYSGRIVQAGINADGSQITVATNSGVVHVRDASSGEVIATLGGFGGQYSDMAFSPDGRFLATTMLNNRINIWDTETGTAQIDILLEGEYRTYSVSYNADGTRILTGSNGATRVWDTTSGQQVLEITGHNAGITSAAYSPDSTRIVTGSADRTVRLWDAENGAALQVIGAGVLSDVIYVTYSRDGTRIASVSEAFFGPSVHIWDAERGEQITAIDFSGASAVRFSPDGSRIVMSSVYDEVLVWDAESGASLLRLSGHQTEVTDVQYDDTGSHIISASRDGTVRIWNANTGDELYVIESGSASLIALSPDGFRIAVGLLDGTIAVWPFPGR